MTERHAGNGADHSAEPGSPDAEDGTRLPPVDFHTFILSLGSSALMALGAVENPETGQRAQDIDLARHNIDILKMLQGKTQGNLTEDEARLLGSLLYDLQIKFLGAQKASG